MRTRILVALSALMMMLTVAVAPASMAATTVAKPTAAASYVPTGFGPWKIQRTGCSLLGGNMRTSLHASVAMYHAKSRSGYTISYWYASAVKTAYVSFPGNVNYKYVFLKQSINGAGVSYYNPAQWGSQRNHYSAGSRKYQVWWTSYKWNTVRGVWEKQVGRPSCSVTVY